MVEYTLFEDFDTDGENPLKMEFKKGIKEGFTFNANDITYEVTSAEEDILFVKMIRYKIGNTATSFIHKCPAKKKAMEKLDKDDAIKLEQKVGKKQFASWKKGRVKMRGHFEQKCPECGVIFWKESMEFPEEVEISKVMQMKRKKKK